MEEEQLRAALGRLQWRLKARHRHRLALDFMALRTGLRPLVMIDYLPLTENLAEMLSNVTRHIEGPVLRIMHLEDCVYLFHEVNLLNYMQETISSSSWIEFVLLVTGGPRMASEGERAGLLEEFTGFAAVVGQLLSSRCSPDAFAPIDLNSCYGDFKISIPTLNGWFLGYPVIYVLDKNQAHDARRCLSTEHLHLYCVVVNRSGGTSSYTRKHSKDAEEIFSFTVPTGLSRLGTSEACVIYTRAHSRVSRLACEPPSSHALPPSYRLLNHLRFESDGVNLATGLAYSHAAGQVKPKATATRCRPNSNQSLTLCQKMGSMGVVEISKEEDKAAFDESVRAVRPGNSGLKARLTGKLCDLLEFSVLWLSGSLRKRSLFLEGNFAPTVETGPISGLPVVGELPACLNGEFVRIGPNPKFEPISAYHWFDGDGMLHGLRIKDGTATYVSRYVRTSRLKQEEYFGAPKFLKIGDMKGFLGIFMANLYKLRVWLGVVDTEFGVGTANTAMVYHNRKLLALLEADKPYAIRMLEDGNLETLGVLDYGKRLSHGVTAHPKVDPVTDELFFFVYQFETPYCIYRIISKDGTLQDPVPINIPEPVMMHDFAITENYALFMDLPFIIRPRNLGEGKPLFSFESSRSSRFGVLPRYAGNDSQMRWFELPACYIFHIANAWEEGDDVVLVACRMPKFELELKVDMPENIIELYEFRFNMKNGTASQRALSKGTAVEFPRINENYTGRKQKYVYTCCFHDQIRIKGVLKFDLQKEADLSSDEPGNIVGAFYYGSGRYGSEAVFVPKSSDASVDEDDGYLITFVYDEVKSKSEMIVIDAKTMSPEPVAVVSIPVRVPYGFHAIFVNEDQLQNQL